MYSDLPLHFPALSLTSVNETHPMPFNQFNSLPDNNILDFSKLEEFVDNNFKFYEDGRKLSKRVENTVGKGELLITFPTVFSTDLYHRHIKTRACLGKS